MMRNWSIPIARLFDVEVRMHLAFLLLLGLVWLPDPAEPHAATVERSLALVAIVFASVVFHEIGHALGTLRTGVSLRSIILLPIGGVSLTDDTTHRPPRMEHEVRIALAGPAMSFAVAGLAAVIVMAVAPQRLAVAPLLHSAHLLRTLVWINVFLGALNLLPAYPLDGGRIVRVLLLRRYDWVRATRRALTLGQSVSTALLFAGMAGVFYERSWSYWLMLVGFFLFVGTQLEDRSAVFHAVLESVRMEDVMLTEFATLSPADTLEDALNKAVHSLQDDFPVIRGADLVGVISQQRILETLRAGGNGYIQSAMTRAFDVARRGDSLASAFGKITGRSVTLIPIVDDERLVGIVTLQNLMHSMSLLAESRKLERT
jgi:Zn-dependent protease/predicted transcriptional regulator